MKKNIAIVFGGYSAEWIISEKSAKVVFKHLNRAFYVPYLIHIAEDGWNVISENGERIPIVSFILNEKKNTVDVVFNAIHGTPGEDGVLAGYFDMLKIPYTSAGVLASSLTFSKRFCNGFLHQFSDLHIANSVFILKDDKVDSEVILNEVGLPCFVKPSCAGSSFGISKVKKSEDLLAAVHLAFEHDNEVIIEQFIDGTEVSNGVYQKDGKVVALPLTEIVSENDFFDYNAKYKGESQEITPARVDAKTAFLVQQTTKNVYRRLGIKGMARVDYIIRNGQPFLIEVNTIPGLSEESILPQQVREVGVSLEGFLGILVEEAYGNTPTEIL